jgi:hypothetical protein
MSALLFPVAMPLNEWRVLCTYSLLVKQYSNNIRKRSNPEIIKNIKSLLAFSVSLEDCFKISIEDQCVNFFGSLLKDRGMNQDEMRQEFRYASDALSDLIGDTSDGHDY